MTREQDVQVPVSDGTSLPLQVRDPGPGRRERAVLVAHELFGVNPDIRGVLDTLADAGYLAAAAEFYHRSAAVGQWWARDDAGRAEGFSMLHAMTRAGALADVAAAVGWLAGQDGISDVAMIGFSAGGHLAYLAATALPIERTVVLYGGWLPTTDIPLSRPEPTLSRTAAITGSVLYLVGGADALIDAGVRKEIEDALSAADVRHELVVYPGVGHAFFWPDTDSFDGTARDDAWKRILNFL